VEAKRGHEPFSVVCRKKIVSAPALRVARIHSKGGCGPATLVTYVLEVHQAHNFCLNHCFDHSCQEAE
jgi:hypothetical protein